MSYSCPVDGCTYEGKQTALMNHIRLKQDSDHTDMYQRFKGGSSDSNDNNDDQEDVDQEDPKLEESFNEAMNDESEEENSGSEVTKLGSMNEDESSEASNDSMVEISEVEIEDVVRQGHASTKNEAFKYLKKAQNKGFSKIDMETGEVA